MAEITSSPAQSQKFSRYRSVRRAELQSPSQPLPAPQDDTTIRSMSRYRKSSAPSKQLSANGIPSTSGTQDSAPLPSIQQSPKRPGNAEECMTEERRIKLERRRALEDLEAQLQPRQSKIEHIPGGRSEVEPRTRPHESERRIQEDHHKRGEHENKESEAVKAVDLRIRLEAQRLGHEQVETRLAEQKRKDLERLEAELEAADQSMNKAKRASVNPFTMFSRKSTVSKGESSTNSAPLRGLLNGAKNVPLTGDVARQTYASTGDTPRTAVNAGERRVLVRFHESSINLPVTPNTTPIDLACQAANVFGENMVPSATVVVESYSKLGLERRIRRYEYIRNVMNSWDRDTQNAIVLQTSESKDLDLQTSSIPRIPLAVTAYLYHSQAPGKWCKKYISLLSNGQIFSAATSGAKVHEKHSVKLCHMSDFDIYAITPQHMKKTLRPPRKYCYAIKSQQKTTIFEDSANYVHFFSTDDRAAAEEWYKSVQEWRSWYLHSSRGSGNKRSQDDQELQEPPQGPIVAMSPDRSRSRQHSKSSIDRNHHVGRPTHAQFGPALNDKPLAFSAEDDDDGEDDEDRPRQIPFHLRHGAGNPLPPPYDVAVGQHSQDNEKHRLHPKPLNHVPPLAEASGSEPFTGTGLLGRTYTQRQKAQRDREARPSSSEGPFVAGDNLLGRAYEQRQKAQKERDERPPSSNGPFTNGEGLLGRAYTQRQKVQHDRDARPDSSDGSFVPVTKTLSRGRITTTNSRPATSGSESLHPELQRPSRTGSVRRPRTVSNGVAGQSASGLTRSTSKRRPEDRPPGLPAPLLDFDEAKFVEAPQWRNKLTGKGVEAPKGVLLVDVATNPEVPGVEMPKGGVFRREG